LNSSSPEDGFTASSPGWLAQPLRMRANLCGGFIEFLFGDRARSVAPPPAFYSDPAPAAQLLHAYNRPAADPELEHRAGGYETDPQFLRQQVDYHGKEASGTIVIDTPHHFLHLVAEGGRAMRYGVRVGRPGFAWSGTHTISAKKEWPDWVPLEEMVERQRYLPHFMPGAPNNPLGACALSRLDPLPQPRCERTLDDQQERLVLLYLHAQRSRDRCLRARKDWH